MKILVLSTCYPRRTKPNHGIFIHRQIRALADLGVECHVIQPVHWAPPSPFHHLHSGWRFGNEERMDMLREVEGLPVHHPSVYLPEPSRFFPGDYWERVGSSVARYIERRPQLRSADLIYAQFLCNEGYAGLIAARRLGIPLVAIARGDDVHGWPLRWPDRKAKLASVLLEADGLLACSQGLARDAAEWGTRGLKRPFEVIYNGVDTTQFSPAQGIDGQRQARRRFGLAEQGRLLLCVATPIEAKGWLDLFDALALLGDKTTGWELVMAGEPRAADDLDLPAEARLRKLAMRLHWLGRVPPGQMPDLYRAADAFVLASHNEGLSNSLLEAMATGLPVVASDVGGHAEILRDGVNGRLVPAHDAVALAEALQEVLVGHENAANLGRVARERVFEMGDQKVNASHLLRYFESLLGEIRSKCVRVSGPIREEEISGCVESIVRAAKVIIPRRYHSAAVRMYFRAKQWWVPTLLYMGLRVKCPCCRGRFRRFLTVQQGLAQNARCPRCRSSERQRLLWLYLKNKTDLLSGTIPRKTRLLHFAPENILHENFSALPFVDYVSADLDSPLAVVKLDIVSLPFGSELFDALVCSHVLEHVPNDGCAMREIFRVLKPGGWAILQVPIDKTRDETFEDPDVVLPEDRERLFGQSDHVRIYGRDYEDRLKEAGFAVKVDGYVMDLGADDIMQYGLHEDEDIYFCTKALNHIEKPESACLLSELPGNL